MALKTASIIGATGLIGSEILQTLQQDNDFDVIRVLVRRPDTFSQSKVEMKLVNFEDEESVKLAIDGSNAVFCAVGTTQKKVKGDKVAYRKVDFDIPVNAARYCAETDCPVFMLVSAVGADSTSNNFYIKLKGEVEVAVQKQSIKSVGIFRPSVLIGDRKESRPIEKIAGGVANFFAFLLVGSWQRYRPADAEMVANAMVQAAKEAKPGIQVYEWADMKEKATNKKSTVRLHPVK